MTTDSTILLHCLTISCLSFYESGIAISRDDEMRYTVELRVPVYDENMVIVDDIFVEVKDVPRWAILFVNSQYSSDTYLPNAFRHEMMIPDEIFPSSWMNL